MSFDTTKTLDELEGFVWGPPNFDSDLVATCCQLRTKPVGEFTVEDLRIMIGQKIGLEYLMPLALDHLAANPWVSGDCYEGDLLYIILEFGAPFWNDHSEWKKRVDEILLQVTKMPVPEHSEVVLDNILHYQRRMGS